MPIADEREPDRVANDNLRAALQQAGLQADDLAQIVQVDVRTVRRWLSGRSPYPRQRAKVARALDTTEHHLWPEIAAASPQRRPAAQATDLVAAYPTVTDLAAPDWKGLMRDAAERIELLADGLAAVLSTAGVPELLAAKATNGCDVRILVSGTGPYLVPLLNQSGIEIRVLEAPAHQTIYRFDEELLLIVHLLDGDAEQAPLLHVRRAASRGLFDRLVEHYSELWEHAAAPIDPDVDVYQREEKDVASSPPLPAVVPPTEVGSRASATPARRWPRRPASADGRAESA